MEKEDIKKLCEERGITYKADFMDGLSENSSMKGVSSSIYRQMVTAVVEKESGVGLRQKIKEVYGR